MVLGGLGAGIYALVQLDPSNAGVGDCIQVNNPDNADIVPEDCDEPEAVYKVGAEVDGDADCPEGDYVEYTRATDSGDGMRLCLMLNTEQGECFAEEGSGLSAVDKKVGCGAAEAEYRITEVIDGTSDLGRCGEEDALAYSEPATTICRTKQ